MPEAPHSGLVAPELRHEHMHLLEHCLVVCCIVARNRHDLINTHAQLVLI